MDIAGIIQWFQQHWGDVIAVLLQIIGAASVVVKLTPTVKDDNILKGIIKFIGKYIALDKYGPKG